MKHLIFISLLAMTLLSCSNNAGSEENIPWNDGYDPAHPEYFDTVVCENGDSLLIINCVIDTIP